MSVTEGAASSIEVAPGTRTQVLKALSPATDLRQSKARSLQGLERPPGGRAFAAPRAECDSRGAGPLGRVDISGWIETL
jgi:hypothetical protein